MDVDLRKSNAEEINRHAKDSDSHADIESFNDITDAGRV
jgi:hypothetical protein